MSGRHATQPKHPAPRLPECFKLCALACRTGLGRCCDRPDVLVLRERDAFPAPHVLKTMVACSIVVDGIEAASFVAPDA